MKIVIHAILVSLTVCSALADDITVQSFPVNTSLPFVKHLLDQPPAMYEGKKQTIPYMFCGVLNGEQIKDYCKTSEGSQSKATSKTKLPNGAICHVTLLSEKITGEVKQIKSAIEISGPRTETFRGELTTTSGEGVLIRCETGSEPKAAEIVVVKITKENG